MTTNFKITFEGTEFEFITMNRVRLGILRRVTMLFRGKRSMYLAGGRVQQMLFQRFKVSY